MSLIGREPGLCHLFAELTEENVEIGGSPGRGVVNVAKSDFLRRGDP